MRCQIGRRTLSRYVAALSCPALLAALFLLSVTTAPARAAQSPGALSWTVEAFFEGVVKYGEWLPIRVTVSNAGSDRRVEIRAIVPSSDGQATYIQPLELAGGARKRVTLYVLPNSFSRRLNVSLAQDSQAVLESTVDVRPVPHSTFVIGAVARQPDGLAALRAITGHEDDAAPRVVRLSTDDVPERVQGLASLDAIVINGTDTSHLSTDQRQAVADWVRLGGQLVLGGGSDAQLTLAGLPSELVPVTVHGTRSIDSLDSLSTMTLAPVLVTGPFAVATSSLQHGRVLAGQIGLPLIVQSEIANGRVTFVAVDLESPPFGAWEGEPTFWRQLLQPATPRLEGSLMDISPDQWLDGSILGALTSLPALRLPSVSWLAALLALYIIMVGPANYLVLRRARRLEWAWLTVPAVTLTFSIGAYGTGYTLRGGETILHTISVVNTAPGGQTAEVRTYAGVFSPTADSYTLSLAGNPTVRRLNSRYATWGPAANLGSITVLQGEPAQVRELTVNQWSMQAVVAETTMSPPVQIDAELTYTDSHLRGNIRAPADAELRDVVLTVGGAYTRIGTLAPGTSAGVDLQLDPMPESPGPPLSYAMLEEEFGQGGPTGPSRGARLKQQVLEGIFSQPYRAADITGPLLLGWVDETAIPVWIEDRQSRQLSTSLIITRPRVHFGPGDITLPTGFLETRLVERAGNLEPCYGRHSIGLGPGAGTAVLEFGLPAEASGMNFHRLRVILGADGALVGSTPEVALYNWRSRAWESVADIHSGQKDVEGADRFVSDAPQVIRLRLELTSPQRGCLFPSVALEGSRS